MNKTKKENLYLYIIVFVLSCCFYYLYLAGRMPNPDSITSSMYYKYGFMWEIENGRFLIGILQFLKGNVVNPTLSTLLSLILLLAICNILIEMFKIKSLILKIFVCIIIICTPAVGSELSLYILSGMHLISYFLSVLSIYLITRNDIKIWPISILLLVISLGIYQAYIALSMVLCILYLIQKIIQNTDVKLIRKLLFKMLIIGVASVICYLLVNKAVMLYYNVNSINTRFSNSINRMGIITSVKEAYHVFFEYYFGTRLINNSMCARLPINLLSFIVIFFFIIITGYKLMKENIIYMIFFIVLNAVLPLAITSFCIISNPSIVYGSTGSLILSSINYIYIYLIILINEIIISRQGKYYRSIIIISLICGLCFPIYSMVIINAHSQSYMQYCFNKVDSITNQIVDKLFKLDNFKPGTPIVFMGSIENGNYPEDYQYLKDSVNWLPASYGLLWNDNSGRNGCWKQFIKEYKGLSLNAVGSDFNYEGLMNTEDFKGMPCFPEEGSIDYINHVIVVKLGNR